MVGYLLGVTLRSSTHCSAPTRLVAVQRYVPDALADAFFTLTVPDTGSKQKNTNKQTKHKHSEKMTELNTNSYVQDL